MHLSCTGTRIGKRVIYPYDGAAKMSLRKDVLRTSRCARPLRRLAGSGRILFALRAGSLLSITVINIRRDRDEHKIQNV